MTEIDLKFSNAKEMLISLEKEVERRGIPINARRTKAIFGKLDSFVKSKKLYKDTKNGKKVFSMRSGF